MKSFKTPRGLVLVTRCLLSIKADLISTYSGQEKAESAWRALVDFESKNLSFKNPSRSFAMVQLADSITKSSAPNYEAADALARQAGDLAMIDDKHGRIVAHALQIRAKVLTARGQWQKATLLHERAEQFYLQGHRSSFSRADNLSDLAACYTRANRHSEAAAAIEKASTVNTSAIYSFPRPYV